MARHDPDEAWKLLSGVINEESLDAYVKLLDANGCPGDEAEEFLGSATLVRTLTAQGMAYLSPVDPTQPPRLIPAPPFLALQAALADLGTQLHDQHNRLLTGHQRLGDFRHAHLESGEGQHPTIQIITDRAEISRLSLALITTARRDCLTLDNTQTEAPLDETVAFQPLPRFKGTVRCRSLYEIACMEHPIGAKAIETSVEAGEEARILPRIGMKLKIIDETVAMLPLTPTGMSGALVVRSPVIINALREYFELLWERATPLSAGQPSHDPPITEAQSEVLRMLAQGLMDEAIASRTGNSVQTVRRHVAALKELLHVETRFAAGVAALRKGWIQ